MAEGSPLGAFDAPQRRSTRVVQAVPLVVARVDAVGRPLKEQTATLSVNCHGCRYFSRYAIERNTWLTLEIPREHAGAEPLRLRARVAWTRPCACSENLAFRSDVAPVYHRLSESLRKTYV